MAAAETYCATCAAAASRPSAPGIRSRSGTFRARRRAGTTSSCPTPSGELDLDLGAIGAPRRLLKDLGLGTNRGVLLHGPPGTGKSAVCRIVAAELAGTATLLFCDALAVARQLTRVYAEVTRLAPALVVLEDIDLLVRRRGPHEDLGLHEFLAARLRRGRRHGGARPAGAPA